ncbi:MAG: metal-sulfur cluster assembly factor [Candidatus Diapherotrites archaeon]|nr:metal-sulfur cluster assembly factor [Candidatus Diapherotrites archaeon]
MLSEKKVWDVLKEVIDPEVGISVVDLGLIYGVEVSSDEVKVKMTLTNPVCPLQNYLKQQVENAIARIGGVKKASVQLVFNPPWSPEMMSAEAKARLGFNPK